MVNTKPDFRITPLKSLYHTCVDLAQISPIELEWSLKITPNQIEVRDPVIGWISYGHQMVPDDIASHYLNYIRSLGCPPQLLSELSKLSETSLNLGLGFSSTSKDTYEAYIHYQKGLYKTEAYEGFSWPSSQPKTHYDFHYFSAVVADLAASPIHPELKTIFRDILCEPKLSMMSGFWLRTRHETVDQISLSFPWLPRLGYFSSTLRKFVDEETAKNLNKHEHHRLKQIAFSGSSCEPSITLYFSAEMDKTMPRSISELQKLVNREANHLHHEMNEQLFNRLYLPSPHNPLDLKIEKQDSRIHAEQGIEKESLPGEWVSELNRVIDPQDTVYLIGNTWQAIAYHLAKNRRCLVTGMTDSIIQFKAYQDSGIKIRWGHIQHTLPPGYFNRIIWKVELDDLLGQSSCLKNLRFFTASLILLIGQDNLSQSSHVNERISSLESVIRDSEWGIDHDSKLWSNGFTNEVDRNQSSFFITLV